MSEANEAKDVAVYSYEQGMAAIDALCAGATLEEATRGLAPMTIELVAFLMEDEAEAIRVSRQAAMELAAMGMEQAEIDGLEARLDYEEQLDFVRGGY